MAELFEMFCEDVRDEVEKLCGFDVEVRELTKNNGVKQIGLHFMKEGWSPIIYLRPYFDINFIKNKETINDIANQIYNEYKENKTENKKYDVKKALEFWKDNIYFEVVNYEANKNILELCPHIRFLDLAIVFRVLIWIDESGRASVLLDDIPDNSNLDEMYNVAKENTLKFFGVVNRNIYDLLLSMNKDIGESISIDRSMYVLTNKTFTGGANLIAIPEVLKSVCEKFNVDDYYIILSSTNELIIIYGIDVESLSESLRKSVKHINDTEVPDTQILSYNLYRFSAETGLVTIVK
jgi:hypothetical protein